MNIKLFSTRTQGVMFILALISVGYLAFVSSRNRVFAACSMATDKGTATQTFNTSSSGTYRVWLRMAGAGTGSNSVLLQIDEALCNINVGDSNIPINTWTWVDWKDGNTASKVDVTLGSGQHTLRLAGREVSAQVDLVLLLTDASCVPTGLSGSNCTAQQPIEIPPNSGSATTGIDIPSSSGSSYNPHVTTNQSTISTGVDPDPVVETAKDVPAAAFSALANPTSIPRVLNGSYGWLVALVLSAAAAVIGTGIWFGRAWIFKGIQGLQTLFMHPHTFLANQTPSSTHQPIIIHPNSNDPTKNNHS